MSALDQEADIPGSSTYVCKNPVEIELVVASTATNWYGHEGSILRYVFLHSIMLAGLVGVLVTLQAYVYPFTMMVLE